MSGCVGPRDCLSDGLGSTCCLSGDIGSRGSLSEVVQGVVYLLLFG